MSNVDADRAAFMELIKLPGTPESRQADHEKVQASVEENIRHVRSAIEKLLDIIRQRFKLPLTKGTDAQSTAALYVLHQAEFLETTLLRLPRSEWRNGKFHECPPTYCGEIVPLEHRDDYVQAVEYLRPLASKLVRAARQIDEPFTTIPAEWISGLEESVRLLVFLEPQLATETPPVLVTIAQVANTVGLEAKSMTDYVREWGTPHVEHRGQRPARYDLRAIEPTLKRQFAEVSTLDWAALEATAQMK